MIDQERALLEGLAKDMSAGRVIGATVREGEALTKALAALQSSPSREEREQALRLAEKAGAARAYVWPSPSAVAAVDMAEARHLLKLDPTPTEGK